MYEVKVKYEKTDENGRQKKVKEVFMFDAVSVTDAETQAIDTLSKLVTGELEVKSAKEVKYTELFLKDGDKYYEAKCSVITIDEKSGKEKKTPICYLVSGYDFESALKAFKAAIKGSMVDLELESFKLTKIVEVFISEENEVSKPVLATDTSS